MGDYKYWFVFLHVLLSATWLGGTIMLLMLLREASSSSQQEGKQGLLTLQRVHRWNLTMYLPIATSVLISGFILWSQWLGEQKPTWLLIKERFGAPVILFIIILTMLCGQSWLRKALAEPSQARSSIQKYRVLLYVAVLTMITLLYAGTVKPA